MTIREQIKLLAGGINGTLFDDAIDFSISVARAELIRAGVNQDLANADEDNVLPLVRSAIVMYGISQHSTDATEADRAMNAFDRAVDQMRKSSDYMEVE